MSEKKYSEELPQWKSSDVERIKVESDFLRGTIVDDLKDEATGALSEDSVQLIKFHGSYQQADRDLDKERKQQKLEPLHSFMIRVRVPGGYSTADQWLEFDRIADKYGSGTLKLTTRQAYQFHGVIKRELKSTMQEINATLLDSIAACGDVNRNVMCTPNEGVSAVVPEVLDYAKKISEHLLPRTSAYHEIWLDRKLVAGGATEEEPIYGKTYLPRKFKIAIGVPPYNDTDLFSNDLGLIAIEEGAELKGFNLAIGGGLGMTFGVKGTYPRLADVVGFAPKENVLEVIEEVVKLQRDYGNRESRKHARLKYTIDRLGVDVFKQKLEARLNYALQPAREFKFESNGDVYGWRQAVSGKWFLGLFIENGRVKDEAHYKLKSGLREVAALKKCDFRLTGNQGLVLGGVETSDKDQIQKILNGYGIGDGAQFTGLRRNSIACVALNTCTMAFAEAERYLPSLIDKIDVILEKNHLDKEDIIIRMTGCPNGCGRPYLGEIGFVGRAPGRYNLYLGAGFSGERLNTLYKEMLDEQAILDELEPLLESYAQERREGERFGDFVIRKGVVEAQKAIEIVH